MKITARFKRLTLWNKIGVIGSMASIIGVIITLALIPYGASSPHIGLTIEQHERILKERQTALRLDLEELHQSKIKITSLEKNLLERELSEVKNALANLDSSYKKRMNDLDATIEALRIAAVDMDSALVADAEAALQQGNTEKADQLFKLIEEKAQTLIEQAVKASKVAGKAAFERGKIAHSNLEYNNADRHFERAVGYSPDNPVYLHWASTLAGILAKHQKHIEWGKKALFIELKNRGEYAAEVATLRNNLGGAYDSLGQYEKAIDYYQQALAS
jgi:tetratricopeptide (TPR) repeat protein